jgi:hypothetical protein
MNPKNFLLVSMLAMLAMFGINFDASAQGGGSGPQLGPQGSVVVPLATNPPFASLPASSTNVYPVTYVTTNIFTNTFAVPVTYTTNVTTNTITGYIDLKSQTDLALQIGYQCTNVNNVSNVIWKLEPSLDGLTCDSTNSTFWITNTSPGSNFLVQSFVWSGAQKSAIAGFFVTQVINLNTNPIFAYITNSTGSNYQFMQYRGTPNVRF